MLNAVYLGAVQPLQQILDDPLVGQAEKGRPLPQTTIRCEECAFQAVATLGAFTGCLRYTTRFTPTTTDVNPAAPWQVELYVADHQFFEAASSA